MPPQTPNQQPQTPQSPLGPTPPQQQPVQPAGPTFQPPQAPMSMSPKKNNTLAIAIIAAVVLLLAAGGVVWWLLAQKNSSVSNTLDSQQKSAQDASGVTKVSWVEPATIPAAFKKSDQSTTTSSAVYYIDAANACSLTTGVSPIPTGKSVKDTVLEAVNAAESLGVKTVSSADGTKYNLKDTDGTHNYDFPSLQLVQSVSVKGVDFTEQQNVVAYKQFGTELATIGIACKTQSWVAQKPALESLLKQFTTKTER